MKLRIVIECEIDAAGNLGALEISAKAPLRSRVWLHRDFFERATPIAREMVRLCFALERVTRPQ